MGLDGIDQTKWNCHHLEFSVSNMILHLGFGVVFGDVENLLSVSPLGQGTTPKNALGNFAFA